MIILCEVVDSGVCLSPSFRKSWLYMYKPGMELSDVVRDFAEQLGVFFLVHSAGAWTSERPIFNFSLGNRSYSQISHSTSIVYSKQ